MSEVEPEPTRAAQEVNGKTEIWFHEDCYIWVPCTHLVGGRLVGMVEAVEQCQELACHVCMRHVTGNGNVLPAHVYGASVGCTQHGCGNTAHLPCANQDRWYLDMDNFRVKCSVCLAKYDKS